MKRLSILNWNFKNKLNLFVFGFVIFISLLGMITTTNAADPYCYPYSYYGDACSAMWITRVTFNTIDNSTDCNEYSDYSQDISTSVKPGDTYDIGITSYSYSQYYNVWIDFNQNGEFEKEEMVVEGLYGNPDESATQSIQIPSDVTPGHTVMRIISEYDGYGEASYDPCIITDYGEAEDYGIFISTGYDAGITSITNQTSDFPEGNYPVEVVVKNFGENTLTSMTIYWYVNGNEQMSFEWTGELYTGEEQTVYLGNYDFYYPQDGPFDPFIITAETGYLNYQQFDDDPENNSIKEELIPILIADAGVSGLFTPKEGFGFNTTQLTARVVNNQPKSLLSVTIRWSIDGREQSPVTFSDINIREGESQDLELGNYTFVPKTNMSPYNFEVWTEFPNGVDDNDNSNDLFTGELFPSLSEGKYTVGGYESNFKNFEEIQSFIQLYGMFGSGYLDFQIRPDNYYGNLFFDNLPEFGFSIIFESETGNASDVFINSNPSEKDNYVFKINGFNDVIFRNITIQNLNSVESNAGNLIDITNAEHCLIENVVLNGISNSPNDPAFILFKAMDVASFDIYNSIFNNGSVSVDLQNDNEINANIEYSNFNDFGLAGIQIYNSSESPVFHHALINYNNFGSQNGNIPESGIWIKGYADVNTNNFSGITGTDLEGKAVIKIESPAPDNYYTSNVNENTISGCTDINAVLLDNSFAKVNNNTISDLPLGNGKIPRNIIKLNGFGEISYNKIDGIVGSGIDGQAVIKITSPNFDNQAIVNDNIISKCENVGGIIIENSNAECKNNNIFDFILGSLKETGFGIYITGFAQIDNNTFSSITGSGIDGQVVLFVNDPNYSKNNISEISNNSFTDCQNVGAINSKVGLTYLNNNTMINHRTGSDYLSSNVILINGNANITNNNIDGITGTSTNVQSVIRVLSTSLNESDNTEFTDNLISNCVNISGVYIENCVVKAQNNDFNNLILGNGNEFNYALMINGFANINSNDFYGINGDDFGDKAIVKVEAPYINNNIHNIFNNNNISSCNNINGIILANNYNDVDNNSITDLNLVIGNNTTYGLWMSGYGNISNNNFTGINGGGDMEQSVIKLESESIDQGNSTVILKNNFTNCNNLSNLILNNTFANITQNNFSAQQVGWGAFPKYGIWVSGYAQIIQNSFNGLVLSSNVDNALIQVESPKIDENFNTVVANNEINDCTGMNGIKLNQTYAIYTNNNFKELNLGNIADGFALNIYGYPLVIAGNNFDRIIGISDKNQSIIKLEAPSADINYTTVIANNNLTDCQNVNGMKLTNLYNYLKHNYMVLNQQNTDPNSIISFNGCSGYIGDNMIIGNNLEGIHIDNSTDLNIIYNSIELKGIYSIIHSNNADFALMRNMLSNEGSGYIYDITGGHPVLKENTMDAASGKVASVNSVIYNKATDLVDAGIDNNSKETKILCKSDTDLHIYDATPEMLWGYPLFSEDNGYASIIEKTDWDGEARNSFFVAGIDEFSLYLNLSGQSDGFVDCENSTANSLTVSPEINYYSDMYYQWDKDGVDVIGANGPVLYFPKLQFSQSGIYRCKIMGPGATKPIYSKYVTVYVTTPTEITVQPENNYVPIGSVATFKFTAHVNGKSVEDAIINDEVKVQWYKWISASQATALNDNMPRISGSKSNYLTINNFAKADLGKYFAEITGLCGVVKTIPAEVFEESHEIIYVLQPISLTNCEGTIVDFTVDATTQSSKAIKYQWYKGNNPIVDNLPKIEGSKTKHLIINDIDKTDDGEYYAVATLDGTQQGKQSDKVDLLVRIKPQIFTQPLAISVKVDASLTLEVVITDVSDPTLKYQWYKENVILTNETNSIFSKAKAELSDDGDYYCIITNDCGQITSEKAKVTITTGTTDVTDVHSNGYILSMPYPNPVSSESSVSYTLPRNTNVNITLYNELGIEVTKLVNASMNSGVHTMKINANSLNLLSGTYFIVLKAGEIALNQRLIILK
jgi:hypothetical protein